jgi:hypothetical protein
LFIGENADLALHAPHPLPRNLGRHTTIEHSGVNLGQVDRAEQCALEDRNNDLLSRLAEKHG